MSVKVEIPEGYCAGRDNFLINVQNSRGLGIKCWSYSVNWSERWIYHDGKKWFPVDALPGLLEWLAYCDPDEEFTKRRQ